MQSTVIFDSRKRDSGSWDDLQLSFARTVTAKQVRINFITFFNTFFNVTSFNGTFVILTPAPVYLVVPPAQYSLTEFALKIDQLLKTVNAAYTCQVVNNAYLSWSIGGDLLVVGASSQTVFGVKDLAGPFTGSFTTLPSLTYPDEIYFRSSSIQRRDHLETDLTHHDGYLFTVLMDAPVMSQVTYRPLFEQWYPIFTMEARQHFKFQLTDSNGRKLEGSPTEWIMSLTFSF